MPGYELFGDEERQAVNKPLMPTTACSLHTDLSHNAKASSKFVSSSGFGRTVQSSYCQVVSSGTAALLVAIRSLGVRPGDEVITSSFTFVATAEAIIEAGAIPVFTEIDTTYNMDPEDLRTQITPRTRLIIPVHMAGAPARMNEILAIAGQYEIPVLEDAAQAFGGKYKGKTLGAIGNAGIFSFDFAKNITTGEGGAMVTASKKVFQRARELHDHGHQYNPSVPRGKDTRRMPGFNFRMTEIQAAIGLAQLAKLDQILLAQRQNKKKLRELLGGDEVKFRTVLDEEEVADTLIFALESKAIAAEVARYLSEKEVGTKNLPDALDWHFAGTWDHMFRDLPSLQNCSELWPKSRDLLMRSIALPVNAKMTDSEIELMAAAVRQALVKAGAAA
jgi:8-amino-3,8-dideoxy-alpha-D-manno-octulosonate transaminase